MEVTLSRSDGHPPYWTKAIVMVFISLPGVIVVNVIYSMSYRWYKIRCHNVFPVNEQLINIALVMYIMCKAYCMAIMSQVTYVNKTFSEWHLPRQGCFLSCCDFTIIHSAEFSWYISARFTEAWRSQIKPKTVRSLEHHEPVRHLDLSWSRWRTGSWCSKLKWDSAWFGNELAELWRLYHLMCYLIVV